MRSIAVLLIAAIATPAIAQEAGAKLYKEPEVVLPKAKGSPSVEEFIHSLRLADVRGKAQTGAPAQMDHDRLCLAGKSEDPEVTDPALALAPKPRECGPLPVYGLPRSDQ